MHLRSKIAEQIKARLALNLPEVMQTAWDVEAVLVMIESLSFMPASGFKDDWKSCASFDGVVRTELRADKIDDLEAEMLIASLLTEPLFVSLPLPEGESEIDEGAHHVKARLTLIDWRDALRDQDLVASLRFKTTGTLFAYSPDPGRGPARLPNGDGQ